MWQYFKPHYLSGSLVPTLYMMQWNCLAEIHLGFSSSWSNNSDNNNSNNNQSKCPHWAYYVTNTLNTLQPFIHLNFIHCFCNQWRYLRLSSEKEIELQRTYTKLHNGKAEIQTQASMASECMCLNTTLYQFSSFKWSVCFGVWKLLFIFMDAIHIQIMKRTRMDWKFMINGCYFTVSEPNSDFNTRSHWPVSNKNRIQNKA